MDTDESMMATLGGVRGEAASAEYLARNLEHWAKHGFGIWMLRDLETGSMMGRAVLRHLEINGEDESRSAMGSCPSSGDTDSPPRSRAPASALEWKSSGCSR